MNEKVKMEKVVVLDKPMNVNSGIVRLTKEQAKSRAHNIKNLIENDYEVLRRIQFKVGEEFFIEIEKKKAK